MMTNQSRIEAILLYFANYTNQKYLGKVKLMKLLYFLDFAHAKRYGTPVTYDTYYNLEHGPIPSKIKNMVDNLADSPDDSVLRDIIGCEKVKVRKANKDIEMCKISPKRKFTDSDRKLFSETEYKTMEEIAKRFKNSDMRTMEDKSHKEAPWSETKLLAQIPYYLAAHDKDAKVSEEEIKLATAIFQD